ncbi:inositolphosphotransferase KNAG_0D01900 [Huiozyma naganishii CBS 8797]|uniref:Inositolphosphotransferase Aur1/Ipt1 domain-containing protein n=1 Tax=Huiozyma naganishii (strain ATCC MYA-139 / BCRC 22969 / CBS 8797 / KCTC 17520 / NBRC 10181 / NCYC 3082 / Yp74L-3) TaxID=1071383 RepID=J7S6T5_HUIN7|nr:hypothetical protein KNAG_0D01900 [Kazachstania naganishii CBS 8797]CCK69941.1 hypothetical protein KNAG_0D01900 [Kazachstania naganishii CBS 8797]
MFWLFQVIKRLWVSAFNQRNILTLPINIMRNFALVLIWLFSFNNAKYIPNNIRPPIRSSLAFLADAFMFGDTFKELNQQYQSKVMSQVSIATAFAFTVVCLVLAPAVVWFYLYRVRRINYNVVEWYDHIFHFENKNNDKRLRLIIVPFALPFLCIVMLDFLHLFSFQSEDNFTKFKDLLAWTSYVIFHVMMPILTAVYLYVFHPAGTVMCFSLALGAQNIFGLLTHLLLPTASPWFIHMYGAQNKDQVNYDQEGYAAGLTRVDTHLGTHINTNGFHKSPIVFGAVPSLHSAIAFQCFLMIVTRASSVKHRYVRSRTITHGNGSGGVQGNESFPLSDMSSGEDCYEEEDDYDEDELDTETSSSSMSITDVDEMDPTNASASRGATTSNSAVLRKGNSPQYVYLYDMDYSQYTSRWYFRIFNRGLVAKTWITSYVCLQWWATMYLDHHYRFDLFVGLGYALLSHYFINWAILQRRVLRDFIAVRTGKRKDIYNESRTYGMRVFQGTRFEWFFDPLA